MGLVTDFLIKSEKAKFWITVSLDILIIFALIFFALKIKSEFNKGFEYCYKNAEAICAIKSGAIGVNEIDEENLKKAVESVLNSSHNSPAPFAAY